MLSCVLEAPIATWEQEVTKIRQARDDRMQCQPSLLTGGLPQVLRAYERMPFQTEMLGLHDVSRITGNGILRGPQSLFSLFSPTICLPGIGDELDFGGGSARAEDPVGIWQSTPHHSSTAQTRGQPFLSMSK